MRLETKYVVAIFISLILAMSILGYGYLNYRYKKEELNQQITKENRDEQIRIQAEKDKQLTQKEFENCLTKVDIKFQGAARLPMTYESDSGKIIFNGYQEAKDSCYRLYKP